MDKDRKSFFSAIILHILFILSDVSLCCFV